jgi:hypothetical protein
MAIIGLAGILAVFSGLVFSGEMNRLLGEDHVYIAGINETGAISEEGSATPFSADLACPGCPLTLAPGSSFEIVWSVANEFSSNMSVTYTQLALGGGWSGSIQPSVPFTLGPGQSELLTLIAFAPSAPGAYFAPVILDASVT